MRSFWCLLKRELLACFLSPIAFVVLFFYWLLSGGGFIWILYILANGTPLVEGVQGVFAGFMSLSLPIVVSLITMRLFAEERKLGTLEALLTTSIRVPELVLAKFFGALFFYLVLWAPSLIFLAILRSMGAQGVSTYPVVGVILSGWIGVILLGFLYVSLGLLMSSITTNQVVSAIASFALISIGFYGPIFWAYSSQNPTLKELGNLLSSQVHLMDFSRGVVDSRFIVPYVVMTVWLLFLTVKVIDTKRS